MSVFRDCPKRHNYQYGLQLQRKEGPQKHFDKGNYAHELFHVYYRLIRDVGMAPGSAFIKAAMEKRMQEDVLQMNFTNEKHLDVFKEITAKFRRFMEEQSPEMDKGIEVLGVEEELDLVVQTPKGRIIRLFGYLDLRYRQNGHLFLRDHKTGDKSPAYSWSTDKVRYSPQLLNYGTILWLMDGSVYRREISYMCTHEYARKVPSYSEVFGYFMVPSYEKEYAVYLEQTLQFIDSMLDSEPVPHYDERVCTYCPFKVPCFMDRMGMDSAPILASQYVPRDDNHRDRTFTGQNTGSDDTDSFSDGSL